MPQSTIRYSTFPRTQAPPPLAKDIAAIFRSHEATISTIKRKKGLTSDQVLEVIRGDLVQLGFEERHSATSRRRGIAPTS